VSLNQELFSLDAGNLTVEELDRRLELAVAALETNFVCDTFTCGSFRSCGVFGCGAFGVKI
ncbi:MAG TPA: hypothetical protein DD490_25520, partial [Acidobacteria bacterium]|nr:hypothetical protein [Acidobacteriota bacterium]